ncbi:MAG: ABC transporter ATP-binding protein [Candidatus Methanomethylophilaceae archaeon]|nr:ABC transporter ATP-binding protein [Candidatus Methanomethylophilaceae archaeon]
MSVIDIKGVYKAYYEPKLNEGRVVLKDINLSISENEFVCIIGPSGCGKTTLLDMIAGFEKPIKGEISYRGQKIRGPGPERAVIFQEYSLLPWMDVQKNVEFSLDRKKYSSKEREEIASKYIAKVNLTGFENSKPNLLSGGMRQRVAIARAFAMQPDILLMDEPFSSLDEQTRKHLDKEILDIWKEEKRTVVLVTHSVEEALLLATRIVLLTPSPGQVFKEWHLPVDKENLSSDQITMLKKDIIRNLGVCACAKTPISINVQE